MRNMLTVPQAQPKAHLMLRYDLIDLQLFLHIADVASITHGAHRSNMSLAAASERVRAMEAALGTDLLVRGRRGVQLTAAGSMLLQHARAVVKQLQQMRGDLDGYAKGLRGQVRLQVNTVAMLEYLPQALPPFLARNPNLDVELVERKSPEIMRQVAANRADIGIVAGAVDPALQLETFPFASNLLVLIMPRRHQLADRRKLTFAETLDYDYVGLGADSALQDFVNQQAEGAARRLKVRVRLSSFDAICQMVEGGAGLAIVPQATARRWRRFMALRIAALTDPWAVRHLTLCVRNVQGLATHSRKLLAHLRGYRSSSKQ
jgi:DNA-binding transcriptional LysR family regulator